MSICSESERLTEGEGEEEVPGHARPSMAMEQEEGIDEADWDVEADDCDAEGSVWIHHVESKRSQWMEAMVG